MVATPLTPSVRFIEPGTLQVYFVPTITAYATPTRTQLDAGTDLTGEVSAIDGFSVSSDQVDAPDFKSRFAGKIPGRITADDSALEFYRSSSSTDVRSILTRDLTGFIVIFPEGDTTGRKMDIFPVTVSSVTKPHSDNDPAKIRVEFTVTKVPATDVAVP